LILIFVFLLPLTINVNAQITVEGEITNAETGTPLPSATVVIKGTYSGTISNTTGNYSIRLDSLPATLQVSYIGFYSKEKKVSSSTDTVLNFSLTPSTEELPELIVTNEDPAIGIMRRVIEEKQKWRSTIKTYQAEAYTRAVLLNDSSIVSITETVSDIFWDHRKGHREVIKDRRQTNNIVEDENFAGVNYVPNFYDDNINISEFKLVGPTHPNALKYYDFELLDQLQMDGKTVFKIKVIPKKELQPTFEGTLFILDKRYAMLEARLSPGEVVRFPPPVRDFQLFYQQQFNNFEGAFWLPADMRIEGRIKIKVPGLDFPSINFRQLSQITNYRINVDMPDSLYENESVFTVDTLTLKNDSVFESKADVVPLSPEEAKAYQTIDSTQTLEEAFKPSGALSGLVNNDNKSSDENIISRYIPGNLSPQGRFNRVDGFFGGLKYELNLFDERLNLQSNAGFATGYDAFNFSGGIAVWPIPNHRQLLVSAGFHKQTEIQYQSGLYSMPLTSFQPLFGAADYFNYYLRKGVDLSTAYRFPGGNLTLRMRYHNQNHSSLQKNTDYDLLGRAPFQRLNPSIDEGELNSFSWQIEVGDGGKNESFGVTEQKGATFDIEHSGDYLNSDFDFTRYTANISYRIATFFRRRFNPNTLDLNIRAGTFSGDLPLQRFGAIDGSLSSFSAFGAMKTLRNIPYSGQEYLSFTGEHSFRSIPFELINFNWPVERGWNLIAFGGVARSWISQNKLNDLNTAQLSTIRQPNGWHSEAGISLSGIFSLFRIDVAYRVDDPSFFFGFGVARLF